MPEQPIYDYIRKNVVDGVLPPSFSLAPYDKDTDRMRFADGAADGIVIYHMPRVNLPEGMQDDIAQVISLACAGDHAAASAALEPLLAKHHAIVLIDPLQRYVMQNSKSIDGQALWRYATHLAFSSTSKELVKAGLALLELFGEPDDQLKQAVRTLGLSDEFTIFAAWCAGSWEDHNEELFQFARKARGWGRIHVIEMLEPETDEIRTWLLHEGVDNDVMPEYSALTCYEKAGVRTLLLGEMSHEDFSAATEIMLAAMSDGPVANMKSVANPREELERYASQAQKQPLDQRDRECLGVIADFAREQGWEDLASRCTLA